MKTLLLATGLLVNIALAAHADFRPSPGSFVPAGAIDINTVIAPPPAPGSAVDRRDFEVILAHQATRTVAEVARGRREVHVSLATFFGAPYGNLTAAEVDRLADFFEKVRVDSNEVVQEVKRLWGRPRPYVADPRVVPAVHRETTNAYPSGHAAIALVFARTLAKIFPERAAMFDTRARVIGQDRVIVGVHHPSDIDTGRELGAEIFSALESNPAFVKAVINARNSVDF